MEANEYLNGMRDINAPSVEELILESGHIVLMETYKINGNKKIPQRWDIPKDLTVFTITPAREEGSVAHLLVLDPQRVDYKRVEIQKSEREKEPEIETNLKSQGYTLVLTQFPEDFKSKTYHLIGLKPKANPGM